MGTLLRVLSESYPMNTNMTGYRWFSKIFPFLFLKMDESSLSIRSVKMIMEKTCYNMSWVMTLTCMSRLHSFYYYMIFSS